MSLVITALIHPNVCCRLSGKEHSVFTGVVIVLCHEREGMLSVIWMFTWMVLVKGSVDFLFYFFFRWRNRAQSGGVLRGDEGEVRRSV